MDIKTDYFTVQDKGDVVFILQSTTQDFKLKTHTQEQVKSLIKFYVLYQAWLHV